MNRWTEEKQWSDRFIPQIKEILASYLLNESPLDEDQQHNTDLIVIGMQHIRIACRVRRFEYLKNYQDEFTVRYQVPNGIKTELAKIIEGWGDYLFYAFADKNQTRLIQWSLIDLRIFRLEVMRALVKNKGTFPGQIKANEDGCSNFIAFKWASFPKEMIVLSKQPNVDEFYGTVAETDIPF